MIYPPEPEEMWALAFTVGAQKGYLVGPGWLGYPAEQMSMPAALFPSRSTARAAVEKFAIPAAPVRVIVKIESFLP